MLKGDIAVNTPSGKEVFVINMQEERRSVER